MSVTRLLLLISLLVCTFCSVKGQVSVDFTADQTEGCGSLQVNFCDNSTSSAGSIVSWTWDLGGVSSSNECQGRIFGTPGNYEICLTVTDSEGNTATGCKESFVIINPLPEPDFEATPVTGCVPLTSTFTYTGTPNIIEFIWGLDGSAGVLTTDGSASPDALSTYTIPDQYNVSLTVTDDKGCTNFIAKNNFITTYEPTEVVVQATETFKCEPPFSVAFVNDNIQPNMTYTWDFGNGVTFIGNTPPPVLFGNSGSYTITVIGENDDTDCRDTLILEDYINIGYGVEFSFATTEGCEDLTVTFSDDSQDAADVVSWDFGDGSPTSSNPTHTYEDAGLYVVTLTRTIDGCISTETATTPIEVFALPDVAYNNDNTLGCSLPHSVNFIGTSADAIEWLWDFGDGTTSTLQNPNHVYNDFGVYNVSLTVINANGCENTISTTNIEVIETVVGITTNFIGGCTPLDFTLEDSTITVVPLTSWNWEIMTPSGLLTSTDEVPNFIIPDTGCFDIVLTVTNQLGCTDTQTFEEVICVGADPLANFEAIPTVTCVSDTVFFNDLSSPFADTWFWDFGNDMQSGDQNPSTVYVDTGFYDVTLFVSDKGCLDQLTLTDYVEVTAPKSRFQVIQNCNNPFIIGVDNNSIGADSFYWDFGVMGIITDTSTAFQPSYTYADTGTYFVSLTTFNFSTGCSHTLRRKIFVHDPLSSFNISATQGCVPLTINGINNSIHALQHEWSGVGMVFSNSSIPSPTITFNDAGTFSDIQLIVTDVNGCSDTTTYTQDILVNVVEVDFAPNPIGGCQPFEVTFNENSSSLYGNNIEWDWIFENNVGTAQGQTVTHNFENLGEQQVSLTVTDDWGCVGNLTVADAVEVTAPSASFEADSTTCTDYPVSFTNNSTGNQLTYAWDFGDGNTSTDENPNHQYLSEGIFTPCLTVTDVYGCTNTFCLEDYVIIADPVSNFLVDVAYASCPPLIVNFTNNSSNSFTYQWDFGDGSGLSDLDTPSHVYTEPGIYDVTLIANSTIGCADTFVIQELVVLDGPVGDFHFEIDTSCAPMQVTFFGESDGEFMYVWDYGDGSPLDTVFNVSTDTTVYTYYTSGTFIPKLGIIDQVGCQRILESPISIFAPELSLDFLGTDTVLCDTNNPITFLNLVNSTGPIDSIEWQFEGGDPMSTDAFEPTVTFDLPGKYNVTLIAHNSYCSDTLTKFDYVRIGDVPVANFAMSDISGCEPLDVTFSDLSTVINGTVAQWHWKFGDGFESFLAQPTHTYTDGTSFDAQLIVTTDVGCVDSVTQSITVFLQPDVILSGDQEICINETTQLLAEITSDTAGVTYFWENSPTLSCTDCFDPIANPIDTTVYTFVAISPDGCETRTTIQVDVRPFFAPVVTISNDTTICANDVAQIFADGGDDVFSYQWDESQPGLSCYNSCLNPIAAPDVSTTYTVTVTNSVSCSSSASIQIDVIDQSQVFASEDRTICLGDTAQLHVYSGNDPVWLVSDGLDCSTCFDPIASPQISTDFIIQVTTEDGCDIIDTVRVNVLTPQNIDAGNDLILCQGESTMLDGQFLGNTTNIPTSYSWSPSNTLDDPTLSNPEAFPITTTTYTFTLTSGDCVLSDSVRVEVVEKTDIEATDVFICLGDSVQLEVIGSADQYEWIPADGLSNPNIANPTATPSEDISYTVIASLATCEPDTAVGTIFVNELPDVRLPALHTMFVDEPILMPIENSNSSYTYEWAPADGLSCTDCPAPTVNISSNTSYSVTVTDLFTGCQIILNTQVQVLDFCDKDLIGIPNTFTPNGDGQNDRLEIKYSSALIVDNYTFRVFDRWGGLLYESKDINDQWDGTSGGKKVPTGVVIYFMEFPCHLDGSMIQKKGDITIYR